MRSPRVLLPILATAVLAAGACTRGNMGNVPPLGITTPPPGALDCSSTPVTASGTVGPEGGSVGAGGHRIMLPPGAVANGVAFSVTRHRSEFGLVQVLPAGQQFSTPATLTLSYEHCRGGPAAGLTPTLFRWNPQQRAWEQVTGASRHDREARTVTAQIDHLSGYAIGAV